MDEMTRGGKNINIFCQPDIYGKEDEFIQFGPSVKVGWIVIDSNIVQGVHWELIFVIYPLIFI